MADTIVAFPKYGTSGGQTVPIKAVDNGDGTYSLATSSSGGGGIGGTTGTTDNAITTASGTGGNTLQGTVVTVAPTTGTFAFNTDTGVLQFGASKDVVLSRGGADILEQKRGANAQTLNVYGTFTDASNYSRLQIVDFGNGIAGVFAAVSGTGTAQELWLGTIGARRLTFRTNNAERWAVAIAGHLLASDDNTYDIGAPGSKPRTIYAATSVLAPNIPVVDTGWTANADGGSKSAVVPSSATLATIQTAMNLAVAGSGDALAATAAKVKALEAALVALLLPNA